MKICLVGNQNSGKTTLFNALTGMNQKVGNWPGVTIEKRTGIIKNTNYELVDLPGTYSLYPYTEEEKVTTNYILKEKPDITINIVDATCLERSLYLTTQLLELDTKVIIALNMIDVLSKKRISIDTRILQSELKTPVCKISALKQIGIEEIIEIIKNMSENNKQKCLNCGFCNKKVDYKHKKIQSEDLEAEITKRYNYISNVAKRCTIKKFKWMNTTETIDKIVLSKIFAIPIFIIVMFTIYFLSVGFVGKYMGNVVEQLIEDISNLIVRILNNINSSEWVQSIVLNGIFKGVSSVLSFVPQIAILFLCISLLESTGYMSRVAFILDNIFRKIGLSGKAIIPFIIGFGCSVPGIMSTKIIDDNGERKMTSILVPFIPCSAKLPIIALFTGYFFRENAVIVSFSLYILSIIVIIISSIILKKTVFTNISNTFITELPDYRIPNIKYVFRDATERTLAFVKRAGTTILFASVIIWFLISFSNDFKYRVNIEDSILAYFGKKISWLFYPMIGINSWEMAVSAIQGLIAKEQVVSSLAIISGFNESNMVMEIFNKASAYAFIVFNLFSAPCFAAILAMRKELGSFLKTIYAIIYQTIVAWSLAVIIYHALLLIF